MATKTKSTKSTAKTSDEQKMQLTDLEMKQLLKEQGIDGSFNVADSGEIRGFEEPGDFHKGEFLGISTIAIARGKKTEEASILKLKDETGGTYGLFASTNLLAQFNSETSPIPVGSDCLIVFRGLAGKAGKGKNPMKMFAVYHKLMKGKK